MGQQVRLERRVSGCEHHTYINPVHTLFRCLSSLYLLSFFSLSSLYTLFRCLSSLSLFSPSSSPVSRIVSHLEVPHGIFPEKIHRQRLRVLVELQVLHAETAATHRVRLVLVLLVPHTERETVDNPHRRRQLFDRDVFTVQVPLIVLADLREDPGRGHEGRGKGGEGRGRTGEGRRVLVLDRYMRGLFICSNKSGLII